MAQDLEVGIEVLVGARGPAGRRSRHERAQRLSAAVFAGTTRLIENVVLE